MATCTGTNSARQATGLPGHCTACAARGHIAAHPNLGCADVGCSDAHPSAQTADPTSTILLPIKVAAYLHGDKEDPGARATFANSDYAEQYVRLLGRTGRYATVCLWDATGQCWELVTGSVSASRG